MIDLLRYIVCRWLGHVLTDWSEVVPIFDVQPGRVRLVWSTNARTEARFCLRCHSAYEQRWAS